MSAPLGRAGVAAVSFGGRGGGLAYVARLVRAVCATWQGSEPWTAALDPAQYGVVSAGERMRFAARVARRAARGPRRLAGVQPSRDRPRAAVRPREPCADRTWCSCMTSRPGIRRSPPDRLATLRAAALRVANSRYTADRVAQAHPDIGPVLACPLGLLDRRSGDGGDCDSRRPGCRADDTGGALSLSHGPA